MARIYKVDIMASSNEYQVVRGWSIANHQGVLFVGTYEESVQYMADNWHRGLMELVGPDGRASSYVLPKARTPNPTRAQKALIGAVRRHALAYYECGEGWDYVVECWSDADILAAIEGCTTQAAAIQVVGAEVKVVADYEADIRGA